MELTYSTSVYQPQIETAEQRLSRLQKEIQPRPIQTKDEAVAYERAAVELANLRKEWDEFTKGVRKATKAAHSEACEMYNRIDKPAEVLENIVRPILLDWKRREEAEHAKEQAAVNAQFAAVNATSADPTLPPLVIEIPKETTLSSFTTRSTWEADVYDIKALCKAVASGKLPPIYVMANRKELDQQARAYKELMESKFPGVRARPIETLARAR